MSGLSRSGYCREALALEWRPLPSTVGALPEKAQAYEPCDIGHPDTDTRCPQRIATTLCLHDRHEYVVVGDEYRSEFMKLPKRLIQAMLRYLEYTGVVSHCPATSSSRSPVAGSVYV